MINYNLYRHYFPVMALARSRSLMGRLGNADALAELRPLTNGVRSSR
jgi:hypothetical protein